MGIVFHDEDTELFVHIIHSCTRLVGTAA
jgi:hypothetical protein